MKSVLVVEDDPDVRNLERANVGVLRVLRYRSGRWSRGATCLGTELSRCDPVRPDDAGHGRSHFPSGAEQARIGSVGPGPLLLRCRPRHGHCRSPTRRQGMPAKAIGCRHTVRQNLAPRRRVNDHTCRPPDEADDCAGVPALNIGVRSGVSGAECERTPSTLSSVASSRQHLTTDSAKLLESDATAPVWGCPSAHAIRGRTACQSQTECLAGTCPM